MSKQAAHKFIYDYYDVVNDMKIERKDFRRFREAMPSDMDDAAIEDAYTAFSGESPYYDNTGSSMVPWRAEERECRAHRIINVLTHDPISFAELVNDACIPIFDTDESILECFEAMAAEGIIGCMEIKTCGKCHIRLYYLND